MKIKQIINQNDELLLQQSQEYQKMLQYVNLYCQTSLNHPLFSFLILPYYYPTYDFINELQYSIGYFGKKYPFNKSLYLKQSDSSIFIRTIIDLYKRYSQMNKWNDVLSASLSYTLYSLCQEDHSFIKFYNLTEEDLVVFKKLIDEYF